MIKESDLNKYYAEIANQLNEIIPVEWKRIIMYAEDLGDSSSVSFYFYTKEDNNIHHSGNIPEDFSVSRNIFRKLLRELRCTIKNLRNEFDKENEKLWYTLTFTLEEDWRFNVKFGYEIDNEMSDFEREVIWAYNEIGLMPKGEFGREVLEEYLRNRDS
mgnify:CR=1 FL=1